MVMLQPLTGVCVPGRDQHCAAAVGDAGQEVLGGTAEPPLATVPFSEKVALVCAPLPCIFVVYR